MFRDADELVIRLWTSTFQRTQQTQLQPNLQAAIQPRLKKLVLMEEPAWKQSSYLALLRSFGHLRTGGQILSS